MSPQGNSGELCLSVNVDHVATVREARKAPYPDPVEAAKLAEAAGAAGITVHLREDRRHIQDHDVERLREVVNGKLNLEIAATENMVRIARKIKPEQVTLVPERVDEITTEGGLDLEDHTSRIQRVASTLSEDGILVSLFLDPDPKQIQIAGTMSDLVGFEINTDAYTKAATKGDAGLTESELKEVAQAAALGPELDLLVFAGHGLTTSNVAAVAALPEVQELNIGHAIVARAVMIGMSEAVNEMLAAMNS